MAAATSYQAVPYEGGVYPQTHPDVLATVASLVGVRPAPPARCRVLDVGCADGANLLGMAAYLPDSDFVGVDAAANQIAAGESLRKAAGLDHVRLLTGDLTCLPDLGQFDYIVAHGVYSWIPEPARRALLALCRERLAPQGVAYISYNTLPGWHTQLAVRDMMRWHTRTFSEPADIIAQGRAIVDFAARASGSRLHRSHAAYLSILPDDYIFHDHLEADNQPFYLHEFIDDAEAAGLQYVGDAELHRSLDLNLPDQTRAMLHQLTDDPVKMEQYIDFLTDRTLRRTLLCRAEVPLRRELDPATIASMQAALPLTEVVALDDGATAYRRPGIPEDMVVAQTPLQRDILERLRAAWPGSVALQDLPEAATELLVACALRGFAQLRTWQAPIQRQPSVQPRVSALVRAQAARGLPLTSALLQGVQMSTEADLALVARLDGRYRPAPDEGAVVGRLGRLGLLLREGA